MVLQDTGGYLSYIIIEDTAVKREWFIYCLRSSLISSPNLMVSDPSLKSSHRININEWLDHKDWCIDEKFNFFISHFHLGFVVSSIYLESCKIYWKTIFCSNLGWVYFKSLEAVYLDRGASSDIVTSTAGTDTDVL